MPWEKVRTDWEQLQKELERKQFCNVIGLNIRSSAVQFLLSCFRSDVDWEKKELAPNEPFPWDFKNKAKEIDYIVNHMRVYLKWLERNGIEDNFIQWAVGPRIKDGAEKNK